MRRTMLLLFTLLLLAAPLAGAAAQERSRIYVHPVYGFSVEFDDSWEALPQSPLYGAGRLTLVSGERRIEISAMQLLSADPTECMQTMEEMLRSSAWVRALDPVFPDQRAALEAAHPGSAVAIYDLEQTDGYRYHRLVQCRYFEQTLGMAVLIYSFPLDSVIDDEIAIARRVFDTARSFDMSATSYQRTPESLAADLQSELDEVNAYWARVFAEQGWGVYTPADLVVFSEAFTGPCGPIAATDMTHYCSGDQIIRVNFDIQMGSLAMRGPLDAYHVVAHEVGHHVQYLRNVPFCEAAPCAAGEVGYPEYEYQASCLVGAFFHGSGMVGPGDELLLSNSAQSFLWMVEDVEHGDGAENARWFLNGVLDGPEACFVFPIEAAA